MQHKRNLEIFKIEFTTLHTPFLNMDRLRWVSLFTVMSAFVRDIQFVLSLIQAYQTP
jgi:hypothetical protein